MQMIDVLQKLREIADRSPEEIGRAIAAAEKLSGNPVTEEMTEKQKKYFGGGKKDDDKDEEKATEGKKPDFLDVDKDGDKKEPMTKALKDKEDKKVDEDVQITLTGSDAVLAEILKLAGQIGAKTSGGPTPVSAPAPVAPKPMGMPSTGPLPSLDAMLGDKPGMGDETLGDEPMMDGAYDASTTPAPVTMGADAAIPSGDDLAKAKLTAPKVAPGDNPLHTAVSFD
jgi:hypothetical protein